MCEHQGYMQPLVILSNGEAMFDSPSNNKNISKLYSSFSTLCLVRKEELTFQNIFYDNISKYLHIDTANKTVYIIPFVYINPFLYHSLRISIRDYVKELTR